MVARPSRGVARIPRPRIGTVFLALAAYVPLLLTHRGMVGADTKTYLYLDPGQLLEKATRMWDPSVGLGTVTHQNIGYLFPMGPYYWTMETLGFPDWISQRLWLGSVIFLAGLGVRYLLDTLHWDGPGVTVATFAYALSPYLLHYFYKHSVILLPFTALPWLIAFTARALRQRGWRYPALFALVALAAGGINATSLVLVLIGPALWGLHAVFVEREHTIGEVVPVFLRVALLTAATSLWWVMGLATQGAYGIDVLAYTETYTTVSQASTATELSRGLGYWFFYGTGALGPWFRAAITYSMSPPAMALSFGVGILAIACALWTRFRYRLFVIALMVVGIVVAAGSHPIDDPSLYGEAFKAFTETDGGLALRSTPRAYPLTALGAAIFIGAGVAGLSRLRPQRRTLIATAALAILVANLSPLWMGRMIDPFLERPEDVPAYWEEAADRMSAGDADTRVLEVPGIEFADYRWGSTVDPITPGLTGRDYAARELVPYGSAASADLMNAIDLPLQDGSFDPDGYAEVLRLLNVGDLVLRSDLAYEYYRTPRPRPTYDFIDSVPGLGDEEPFGDRAPNTASPEAPLIDDLELGFSDDLADPAPVTIYPVDDPLPLVRTVSEDEAVIVAGDGAGVVGIASAGLLDAGRLFVYSGTVSDEPEMLDQLLDAGAELVVTDTNRKAGRRWGTTKDNDGFTEMADETIAEDPTDARLDLFERDDTSVQTVAVQRGPVRATASDYGNPLSYTPGDRAANAVDDDPDSAWKVGAFSDVTGEWIELQSNDGPLATDSLRLVQATEFVNRRITELDMQLDDEPPTRIQLGGESWEQPGQTISLPDTSFERLRLTVVATDAGIRPNYDGLSGVGFSTIDLGLGTTEEFIRPPTDLLDATGADAADHTLSYVFRRRVAPPDSLVADEETTIRRLIDLPSERAFEITGKARIDSEAPDASIDALLGVRTNGATHTASSGLRGDALWRASAAFDGDQRTAWQHRLGPGAGEWLEIQLADPVATSIDSLTFMTDGRHSVPTAVHFEVDGVARPTIELDVDTMGERGDRTSIAFPPVAIEGQQVRLVIDATNDVEFPDWLSGLPVAMPVGIAEVGGAPELLHTPLAADAQFATGCVEDLISIDDQPFPAQASGSADAASRGELIDVAPCADAVALDAGEHQIRTSVGGDAALPLDVDLLTMRSPTDAAVTTATVPPTADVVRNSPGDYSIELSDPATEPFWLMLGQSHNAGWKLTADGIDLGEPTLAGAYANGWRIDPDVIGRATSLELQWTPQRAIWWSLAISGIALTVCLGLAVWAPGQVAGRPGRAMRPTLVAWNDAFDATPSNAATIWVTIAAGAGGAIFVGWWWGLAIAGLAVAALRTAVGWVALRLAIVAILGLAAAYVIVKQMRNDYGLGADWPAHFTPAHRPAMAAYVLLGVEALVEVVRGGWRRDADLDPLAPRRFSGRWRRSADNPAGAQR